MNNQNGIMVERAKDCDLISRFVFNVYAKIFGKLHDWKGDYNLDIRINDILNQEKSIIFVARPSKNFNPEDILGTMRAIYKNNGELPIEKDFQVNIEKFLEDEKCDPANIIEIARFATNHELSQELQISPRSAISYALLREMCLFIEKEKVKFLFASIDERVLKWLQRIGFNWKSIGETKFYIGSPTVPVMLKASEMKKNLEIINPELYEYIYIYCGET